MKGVLILLLPLLTAGVPYPQQCRLIDSIPFFQTSSRSAQQAQEIELLTEFARFAQSRVPVMLGEFARYKKILETEPQALLRSIHRIPKARLFENAEFRTDPPTTTDAATDMTTDMETTAAAMETTAAAPMETTAAAMETTAGTTTTTTTTTTTEATDDDDDDDTDDDHDHGDEIEKSIEDAVDNIVSAIKETFQSFKEEPLSISTIQSIGTGVINGVKAIAAEFGFELPSTLPDLPDVNLPEIPELGEFNLADWPWVCKVIWWPHDDDHCASMRCAACGPSMMAAARACQKSEGSVSHFCLRRILGDGGCVYCAADYLGY